MIDPKPDTFEMNVDEKLRPSIERKLTGTTSTDLLIHSMPIPRRPLHVTFSILILRLYRKLRPQTIGNRCVFEPSCSHYSEMAIRENGLWLGIKFTLSRLSRCRPGNGGIDHSYDKEKAWTTK